QELKITAEQAQAIQAALDFQGPGTAAKIQGILTAEQKTAWTRMVGQPFQLAGGFRGPGAGPVATATPARRIRLPKDFKIELLYSVPRETQGSWVSLCVLPDGRLIASDQGGAGLYRITPPPLDGKPQDTRVEQLPANISGAQGLLWAFDSLYV